MPKVKNEILEPVKKSRPKKNINLARTVVAPNYSRHSGSHEALRGLSGIHHETMDTGSGAGMTRHKYLGRVIGMLFWFFGLCILFFVLLNWGFVVARVKFLVAKPDPKNVIVSGPSSNASTGTWPKDTLAIPSLGVLAPVVYVSETGEKTFQSALLNGVVHYPGSSLPGEVGNVYIFGHSSDYAWSKGAYKSVFALLPKIKKGAEIKLTDSKGFMYTYLVTEQKVVGPNDVSVLAQDTAGKRILTLQTSYPIGTALKRYVVRAELRQSD